MKRTCIKKYQYPKYQTIVKHITVKATNNSTKFHLGKASDHNKTFHYQGHKREHKVSFGQSTITIVKHITVKATNMMIAQSFTQANHQTIHSQNISLSKPQTITHISNSVNSLFFIEYKFSWVS